MTETFQEQKEAEKAETAEINFATIEGIYEDGVTLIFDGQSSATEKHYKCNAFERFAAGQRVKVVKDSGTYVVEYPVGNPKTLFVANAVTNQYDATYSLQFKTDSLGAFFIRRGTTGTWKKITVT